jgi:hypothetical protein
MRRVSIHIFMASCLSSVGAITPAVSADTSCWAVDAAVRLQLDPETVSALAGPSLSYTTVLQRLSQRDDDWAAVQTADDAFVVARDAVERLRRLRSADPDDLGIQDDLAAAEVRLAAAASALKAARTALRAAVLTGAAAPDQIGAATGTSECGRRLPADLRMAASSDAESHRLLRGLRAEAEATSRGLPVPPEDAAVLSQARANTSVLQAAARKAQQGNAFRGQFMQWLRSCSQ